MADQECVVKNTCEVMLNYGQTRDISGVTITVHPDELALEIYGKSERRAWVAVGFSDDLRMVGSAQLST